MNIEHLLQINRQHHELIENGCGKEGCGGATGLCSWCDQPWPCETHRLVIEVTRLQNELRVAQSDIERLSVEVNR